MLDQREVTDADDKLKRLYRLIEDGMTEMDDVLKDRLNSLKANRDRTKVALERAKSLQSEDVLPFANFRAKQIELRCGA